MCLYFSENNKLFLYILILRFIWNTFQYKGNFFSVFHTYVFNRYTQFYVHSLLISLQFQWMNFVRLEIHLTIFDLRPLNFHKKNNRYKPIYRDTYIASGPSHPPYPCLSALVSITSFVIFIYLNNSCKFNNFYNRIYLCSPLLQ